MNAAGNPKNLAATAVVAAHPTTLRTVTVGVVAAGQTLKLHDCTTTVAAAAGNLRSTIALDAVGSYVFDAAFRDGLVAVVSGGTPDICIVSG